MRAGGAKYITVISLEQKYVGHAKQVAMASMSGTEGANHGRLTIVVDDDIDPTNDFAVLWALSMRSDPVDSIEIVRGCRTGFRDIAVAVEQIGKVNSRAIILACKPFDRIKEFEEKKATFDSEARQRIIQRYGDTLYE